ncbi:unnamed protein product [Linum trigynum]|uniref:Uncharacterized protein n=1 Tax=Linum trigynum TaxID=586398 RepID=A0AAV2FDQ9_9ROSI
MAAANLESAAEDEEKEPPKVGGFKSFQFSSTSKAEEGMDDGDLHSIFTGIDPIFPHLMGLDCRRLLIGGGDNFGGE